MRKILTSKSFTKTVSWMLVSGAIIALPTFYATGSLMTALEVAFWACLFKTPVYWLHEVAWSGKKRKAIEKRLDRVIETTCRPLPVLRICPAAA
jgi:uncharacterized membrane protein